MPIRVTTKPAVTQTQGTTSLADADKFVVDGINGARGIDSVKLASSMMDKSLKKAESVGVGYGKSGMYRGANLGSGATFAAASTAEQRAAIAAGTFENLFIGDYWTVNNRLYRIADFNYWKKSGDTSFEDNHVVLVPDTSFGNGQMNASNITTGAYVGSKMYTDESSVLNVARSTIATDFGGYLAEHREYLPNAVTSDAQSAGAWFDSTVELMNEIMVYGHPIYCAAYDSSYLDTIDKHQLALFKLNPAMINLRYNYWLRDVVASPVFALVGNVGGADANSASGSAGVRPAFAVKGTVSS